MNGVLDRVPAARASMALLPARGVGFWAGLITIILLLAACAASTGSDAVPAVAAQGDCQIVFDAGSSGTRLFVYVKRSEGWVEQAGPKIGALADPVRQIRGKTFADIDGVTTQVVAQLDRIRSPGPLDVKGRPEWQAFDWTTRCLLTDAMVLATAGMRIAEHEDPAHSRELWMQLRRKLQARVGPDVRVSARTLTGFEEGLFAWLAVRETRADNRFGIAEMGGASTQVAFPCSTCDASDDALRTVRVKGERIRMYSYAFLGLGQDEAPKTLGLPAACAYGVALQWPGWQPSDCASRIPLADAAGLKDPYNFAAAAEVSGLPVRGTARRVPTSQADVSGWFLTGAFKYMSPDAVSPCCLGQGACYDAPTSCFRAVYLDKYLDSLGIPASAPKADVSWTLGAAICSESRCLPSGPAPVCRWSAAGCL